MRRNGSGRREGGVAAGIRGRALAFLNQDLKQPGGERLVRAARL
jgi:hypothetical protein